MALRLARSLPAIFVLLVACAFGSGATGLSVAPGTLRSNEVTLIWSKPAGATAGIIYRINRDGKPAGETIHTHFTAHGLSPSHRHVFEVSADGYHERLELTTRAPESVVSVIDFGAKGDGTTLNTKAIQAAIDACPANGVVRIPAGVFVSGALFLKSDLTLEIAAGATLQGSAALADYEPLILNRFAGWELKTCASLLNAGKLDHTGAPNVRHLSIRGAGKISGGGAALAQASIDKYGLNARGRLLCLMNCSDLEIQGVTLEQPPGWTLHYIYSENVTCHDLTITTAIRNGDGLDPDSSRNCYIFNCTFDTGDDCIAIKSGKNPEGDLIARPTENVRIFDCRFLRGHGISIGSEMSGGVRGVLVEDCVAGPLLHGFQVKGTPARGGFVEDVTVRDCDLQKITILSKVGYNNDGAAAPAQPYFRNFHFSNLDLRKAKPASPVILINGFSDEGHRTKNLSFENITLPPGAIVTIDQAEDVAFSKVTTADGGQPAFKVTHAARVTY